MISVLLGVLTFVAVAVLAERVRTMAQMSTRSHLRRRSRPTTSDRAERLAVLEQSTSAATQSQLVFRQKLRPQLRFVVIDRLLRHGIDLDTDPRAETLLGPLCWSLLRTDDATAAKDPDTEGLTDQQVRALTEMLKRIR